MKKSKVLLSLALALLIFSKCTEAPEEILQSPNGLWKQIGYGRILELSDSTIKVFDLNAINCMMTLEEDILDFAEIFGVNGDTLTLKHGIDHWKCVRIDSLPALCSNQKTDNKDPFYNFDVFWQNFSEHYCSFDIKNLDWDEIGSQYRVKISSETRDLELYLIFEEMIALLEDGHIKMPVPESIEEEYESALEYSISMFNALDEFEISESLALLYVDTLHSFNAGMSRWGMIGNKVGFVQINWMLMQADYNLDKDLNLQDFGNQYWNIAPTRKDEIQRQDEVDGMKATLDKVLAEMPDATSFIIDLRFNGGGKDGVAMEIIRHFSSHKGTMAVKYVQENGQFVNYQNIVNTPRPNHFKGPVYLLTSHLTASASELTVLCSLADENFTRIGSRTEGVFSSTLDKVLPNGWAYEFSNEIYEDLNGENYEHLGIPPDFIIPYAEDKDKFLVGLKTAILEGADPAIEVALQKNNDK